MEVEEMRGIRSKGSEGRLERKLSELGNERQGRLLEHEKDRSERGH